MTTRSPAIATMFAGVCILVILLAAVYLLVELGAIALHAAEGCPCRRPCPTIPVPLGGGRSCG